MNFLPSAATVRKSLAGHSWIGLLVGVLMYLVCLSGTIVVFYQEIERWEQPAAPEFRDYEPAAVSEAFNRYLDSGAEVTEHIYLTLPTEAIPRVTVSNENSGRFVNADGSLGGSAAHDWTHLLTYLHLYLHLPNSFGIILVSILGVMLAGLIITGFLAHPNILRDAFSLRLKSSPRIGQVDIHNRLSVWGAPFHLIIAITGAWFGLVMLVIAAIAATSDVTEEEVSARVFGDEPELEQTTQTVDVESALTQMQTVAPEAQPMYMTLHNAGTPGQFMEFFARHPDRMIYSENYRFDTEGNYLGKAGFSDGETGKQIIYSIYRLHFGHFGGFGVKLLYAVLGLALTVVSVTGINIWLAKRKKRDWINLAWPAFVWSTPTALALSGITQVLLGIPSTLIFWLALATGCAYGLVRGDETNTRWQLQAVSAVLLAALVSGYSIKYGAAAFSPAGLGVSSGLLATALVLAAIAWWHHRRAGDRTAADRETPAGASIADPAPES